MNDAALSVLRATSLALVATLAVACGGASDGEESTGDTSQAFTKPTPPPPVTPCPTGSTCSVVATNIPAPLPSCGAPLLFTETGKLLAEHLVAVCAMDAPGQTALSAWMTANPTYDIVTSSTVPGLEPLTVGAYVSYVLPTPTSLPGGPGGCSSENQCSASNGILLDPSNNPLPCTSPYSFTVADGLSSWAAYCVDLPSVDAFAATLWNDPPMYIGGESGGIDGLPGAAPGYVYVYFKSNVSHIGNGCSRGCVGL